MARVQTQVQAVAVNKHLARVQMAGEFATHLGGSKRTVETTQRGIAEHTISEIVVLGIDSQGNAVMDHTFEVDHASHEGDVLINSAEGISMLQAFDESLAAISCFVKSSIEAQGLRAEFRYRFAPHVQADPELARKVMADLQLISAQDPQRKAGTTEHNILDYRPGQDKGIRQNLRFWK